MKPFISYAALILSCVISTVDCQVLREHRYPKQTTIEDSTHVFWTSYPNPFSPPTLKDTSKALIYGDLTFYCDLSDTAEVALVARNDSIVYSATVVAAKPPHFSIGYWVAGRNSDQRSLPASHFTSSVDDHLKVLLIVHGRRKVLRDVGIPVKKGMHYWIESSTPHRK
jgi:hypothetical protein